MWVHIVIFIILLCALAGWEKGWIPSSGIGGKEGIRLFMVVAISGNLLGMILTAGNGRQVYPQGYRLEKEDTGSYEKEFMVSVDGEEPVSMYIQVPEKELEEKIDKISVYARVSPEHKIRIVKAWQKRGNIVSMTGDGVNDAPALKQADIGVAMGITGTEVAKDAAAMILTDDNFATIIKAVTNGRNIYRNIKNAILFLLSGNMAGILSVLYTSLLGLPVPFAPVHLLFINLLTDSLPAIAIGVEPQDASLLEEKPRQASEGILSGETFQRIMLQGLCIAASTMAAFYIGNGKGAAMASTMAFATLTLARLFHGFNCRGNKTIFALGFTGNPYSILAFVSGSVLLGLVLFVPPLRGLFSVESLSGPAVIEIILLAALPTVVIQMVRGVRELKK